MKCVNRFRMSIPQLYFETIVSSLIRKYFSYYLLYLQFINKKKLKTWSTNTVLKTVQFIVNLVLLLITIMLTLFALHNWMKYIFTILYYIYDLRLSIPSWIILGKFGLKSTKGKWSRGTLILGTHLFLQNIHTFKKNFKK